MTDLQKCDKYLKLYNKSRRNNITPEEEEEMFRLMEDINNMQSSQDELDEFLEKTDSMF